MTELFRRIAGALGWTPGQAWTFAVGLVVAVPAALLGLGPTMAALRHPGLALATPPAAAATTRAPTPPPAILTPPAATPSSGSFGATASTPETGAPTISTNPPAVVDNGVFATIQGAGAVRSLAVAADAVVVAVDPGAGTPGRVVILDRSGAVVRDTSLVINGVPYQQPGGVAVVASGVLVTTASPAAVLRVDSAAGTVTKVADVPDVPVCLPIVQPTNCQAAVPDSAPQPQHLAAADSGDIFVADRGQACIFRVGPGESQAVAWLCDISFAASPSAGGNGGLGGVAVAGDNVVFTVAAGFDGTDSVQEATVANGAPASRHQLAAPASGAGTAGVTVLPDGRIVAALTNSDALFVIAADGSSSRTVNISGISGPDDVDVLGDTVFIAHRVDSAAGGVAKRPISTLS